MTNKQFDEQLRRRIDQEVFEMSTPCEDRITAALRRPEMKKTASRVTLRAIALAVMLAVMLCGVALAAINWGSREVITYEDSNGETWLNEELAGHVQPVGEVFESDALRIDMIDAIYDGRSLVLAWTTENKLDGEEIFLLCDVMVNGESVWIGSDQNMHDVYLAPGEIRNSGFSRRLTEGVLTGECEVELSFSVLKPTREAIGDEEARNDPNYFQPYYLAYMEMLLHPEKAGQSFSGPEGPIQFDSFHEGMSDAEILVSAGRMELLDILEVSLTLPESEAAIRYGVPEGEFVEQDNGDYILRVTKAEFTPNTATIEVERVFPDEATAMRYADYFQDADDSQRFYWNFDFGNESPTDFWYGWYRTGFSHNIEARPQEQADGTWVWPYGAQIMELKEVPETLTITPTRDDTYTGERNVLFPEEAITLTIK